MSHDAEPTAILQKVDVDPDAERADFVRRLIAARAPEVTPRDIAMLAGEAEPDPDAIPASITDKIMDILLMFEDRLERIERAVHAG